MLAPVVGRLRNLIRVCHAQCGEDLHFQSFHGLRLQLFLMIFSHHHFYHKMNIFS